MMYRALTDETGAIRRTFGASFVADLDAATAGPWPEGWVVRAAPALLSAAREYWNGSAWVPRLPPPPPPEFVAGIEATWAGLQPGAVVTAVSRLTGQIAGSDTADAAGAVQLKLPAGPWRLIVNEAFPAIAASFDIEVAEP